MTDVEMARQAVGRWKATAEALARDIWSYAELPYCETKSAAALCGALEREGFSVETHVAGIPTCFTAVFRNGTGTPVVGLLAEFDALDGLSIQLGIFVLPFFQYFMPFFLGKHILPFGKIVKPFSSRIKHIVIELFRLEFHI